MEKLGFNNKKALIKTQYYDNIYNIYVLLEEFITKKLISILLVLVICFTFTVPCFASSGINDAEMQVLKMLDKGAKYDESFYQYRNALKNYFNRDSVSITQVNADIACDYLVKFYDSFDPEEGLNEKKFFDVFRYVLMYINVRVIYDRANSKADLIGTDGSVVMADLDLANIEGGRNVRLNPIKNTGTNESVWLWCAAGLILAAVGAVSFVLIKRKGREEVNGD